MAKRKKADHKPATISPSTTKGVGMLTSDDAGMLTTDELYERIKKIDKEHPSPTEAVELVVLGIELEKRELGIPSRRENLERFAQLEAQMKALCKAYPVTDQAEKA
jgi:hypothetical protein